jgi:hypothetical protein
LRQKAARERSSCAASSRREAVVTGGERALTNGLHASLGISAGVLLAAAAAIWWGGGPAVTDRKAYFAHGEGR